MSGSSTIRAILVERFSTINPAVPTKNTSPRQAPFFYGRAHHPRCSRRFGEQGASFSRVSAARRPS